MLESIEQNELRAIDAGCITVDVEILSIGFSFSFDIPFTCPG